MGDLTREEMLCARIDIMKARIDSLEKENSHYLELINRLEKENEQLRNGDESELDK